MADVITAPISADLVEAIQPESTDLVDVITQELITDEGRVMATSLQVAAHFGKAHNIVMRAIRNLECSDEFNRCNFAPIAYIDDRGREQPCYRLTRDGFAFLAMGFTGKGAARWKEAYIAAFNAMEAQLRAIQADQVRHDRDRQVSRGLQLRAMFSLQDQSWKLIQRLERATNAQVRATLHAQLVKVCADLGQDAPPLHAIGRETPPQPEAAAAFWAAYQVLQQAGVRVNHSHKPNLIAVNLRQFAQLATAHGLRLPAGVALKDALRLSVTPRFLDVRTVRSAIVGSVIHCWIFEAAVAQEGGAA